MKYRHAYHAGNFADVHKHLVLVALLRHLLGKPRPFFCLDTHAGAGRYDLDAPQARLSGEWSEGIGRLSRVGSGSPELLDYLNVVRGLEVGECGAGIASYPGSPWLVLALRRAQDRCVFAEQNPGECEALRRLARGARNVTVLCGDGYAAIRAQLPPRESRGLVFIDPPYESADEVDRLVAALVAAHARWSHGLLCAWYPIKADGLERAFKERIAASGVRKVLALELGIRPADSPLGLNGSGLLLVNPPWRLDERMRAVLPELQALLAPSGAGEVLVDWLVPE